jgi:two-component system, NtrC family, response regulator HydG
MLIPSQMRILSVEDDPSTYALMAWVLKGYQFTRAATKAEALRLVANEEFDLFILDNYLPDGFGRDISAFIRLCGQGAPIIFVTADDSLTESHLPILGAQRLVRKGQGFCDELKGTISELLNKKGKQMSV